MTALTLMFDSPIDLQLHTVYSDGTWTPEQLINTLHQEGFGLAAITDHDRVDTLVSLQHVAHARNVPLLVAVEMSAHWHEGLVDVLCYGFDPETNALRPLTDALLNRQRSNILQTVETMRQQGYTLPSDDVQQIFEKPVVQQPHALVDLVQRHGYGSAERSAGRLLVSAGLQQLTTDIKAVVEAVHQSGGVCLIAHPGRGDGYVQFEASLLDQLRAEVPIDGFEVYYPAHTAEQVALYGAYAEQHNLLISAGSDSHSLNRPPIKYRAELCHKLLERLGISIQG